LGGTLSTSWSLLWLKEKKPNLEYDGTKKLNGSETHILNYSPRGGSDLSIKMYFDARTFRHVRTEYRHAMAARQGATVDDSARQSERRQELIEEFSDYKKINGMDLPSKYRLLLTFTSQTETREYEWKLEFMDFAFNQPIDSKAFDLKIGE
jgi:outer membrane lipoprotein-sorting protein